MVWKSRLRYLDKWKELALMNIFWKFEEVIFITNKELVYNVFSNMTS